MLEISTKICFLTDKFFVLFSFSHAIIWILDRIFVKGDF